MKTRTQSALILTLLMLLLVAAAAFVFLFQGRQILETDVNELETVVDELETAQDSLSASLVETETELREEEMTRVSTEQLVVTAAAEQTRLAQEIEANATAQADLNAELAQLEQEYADLSATREAVLAQPPQVALLTPTGDETVVYSPGVMIEISIVAADPAGVAGLTILVDENEQVVEPFTPAPLITYTTSWSPQSAGSYRLQVSAANVNGISSTPVERTIQIDIAQTALQIQQGQSEEGAAARAEVETAVHTIRQLTPAVAPNIVMTTSAAPIENVITAAMLPEHEVMELALLLRALGLLTNEDDLTAMLTTALAAEQTTFYDPGSGSLYLTAVPELTPDLQLAYAAAYTRFLQDQTYALTEPAADIFTDTGLAVLALAQGEARFVQEQYAREQLDYDPLQMAEWSRTPLFPEEVPGVVSTYLEFPAVMGEAFVNALVGVDEEVTLLDEVWLAPPVSSEQVLHPQKYINREGPLAVALPELADLLEDELSLTSTGVLGEWRLRQMLAAPGLDSRQRLTPAQVDDMASGWGGDQYAIYSDDAGDELLLVLQIAWDTESDADEFRALFANYALITLPGGTMAPIFEGAECWQGESVLCLLPFDGETVIVRAPDEALAVIVLGGYTAAE